MYDHVHPFLLAQHLNKRLDAIVHALTRDKKGSIAASRS